MPETKGFEGTWRAALLAAWDQCSVMSSVFAGPGVLLPVLLLWHFAQFLGVRQPRTLELLDPRLLCEVKQSMMFAGELPAGRSLKCFRSLGSCRNRCRGWVERVLYLLYNVFLCWKVPTLPFRLANEFGMQLKMHLQLQAPAFLTE